MAMGIEIRLFGETRVRDGDRWLGPRDLGGVKPRRVLEYLALHAGHPVPKDRLIDALWEGEPPESAVATLEAYVSLLRRLLQPGVPARASAIRTVNGGYQLDRDRADVDLAAFRDLLAAAEVADGDQVRSLLRQALAMSGGGLRESEPYAAWAVTARARSLGMLVGACTAGARRALDCGDLDDALAIARRAVALDPLAEDAARTLVEGLWRAGRRGEALRSYDDLRRRLDDDLGVEPSAPTRALYLAVLRDAAPTVPTAAAAAPGHSALLDELVRLLATALADAGEDRARDLVSRLTAALAAA